MYKVCVVTATRAEYGLLKRVLGCIGADEELELCLAVTGTHLSHSYGYTVCEIEEDGFPIAARIDILDKSDNAMGILTTIASATEKFGRFFVEERPDMLVVLGDRYELLAICQAAMVMKIPIAHISGGEITEGAMDDTIRHCITKLSRLHFPGCEAYRRRIIQLGEQPDSVYNYGDVGVENILKLDYMEKNELEESIGFMLDRPYACVTFHPETLDALPPETQLEELLRAIDRFADMKFIFTGANADAGGQRINERIQSYAEHHSNCVYYASLGIRRFLSLMKNSELMLGNSSSGIVETPCFGIPTVNIGDRQKGRLQADSIINCPTAADDIMAAIKLARTPEFRQRAKQAKNPYEGGDTSIKIVETIKNYLKCRNDNDVKKFYDLY